MQRREDELTTQARRGKELEATLSKDRARFDEQKGELLSREERINALQKVLEEQKMSLEETRADIKTKAKVWHDHN